MQIYLLLTTSTLVKIGIHFQSFVYKQKRPLGKHTFYWIQLFILYKKKRHTIKNTM